MGDGDWDPEGRRSAAEFERAGDPVDDTRPARSLGRALIQQNRVGNKRVLWPVVLVLAASIAVGLFSGSGSAKVPTCKARSASCQQSANGIWIPAWYYGGLALAQGTSGGARPSTTGAQPTTSELEESGATPGESDEAESYARSSASDSAGDDSGSNDDSGSDDSGDDGGGGDGGGDDGG